MRIETPVVLRDWIALSFVVGVGSRTAGQLIRTFGAPTACFEASPTQLEAAGLQHESIAGLHAAGLRERADRELDSLTKLGAQAIVLHDERYPPLLREVYDPPIVLYCRGDLSRAIERPVLAVVGSRRCSTYGKNAAEMLARELGKRGVTIVSGLARGIDTAAHRGVLDGRGLTIGVLGTGIDSVYPKENRRLAEQIVANGALVTEFPLGTPPLSQNFPYRNRVISGLALGVMVVEGAERSGSLITARLASEQGRDVFAVPGNITSAKSFGPNNLIKDGAKLVQTWSDVVEEFPFDIKSEILAADRGDGRRSADVETLALSEVEARVLSFLTADEAIHIDKLITRSGLSSGELMGALLKLEMSDLIRQLPGKTFVRRI
jgi:DNA processing protein